jgi:hypothetical protein
MRYVFLHSDRNRACTKAWFMGVEAKRLDLREILLNWGQA